MKSLYETKSKSHLEDSIIEAMKEIDSLKDEIDKLNKINDHLVNQLMYALELKDER